MRKIIVLLLLLISCQMVPFQIPFGKQDIPKMTETRIGTSALEISFTPLPNNILMCQQANIIVNLKNTGAFNITDGLYNFIFEGQYLEPIGERKGKFSLEGKSLYNPVGGVSRVEFMGKNKNMPAQLESFDTSVLFHACYLYETFADVPVCIDPDIQNLNPKKVCTAQPITLSGGQGAPVAVTGVESKMIPEGDKVRPMFAVYIQNLGTGNVVSTKGIELACFGGKGSGLESNVTVRASLLNRELECSKGSVRLNPGEESRIVCEAKDAYGIGGGTFSSVLSIGLKYGYVNTAIWPISVSRVPGKVC